MKKEFYFPSSDQKTNIRAVLYVPATNCPRGIIHILHGMVEHFGRYEEFALFLTEHRFIVCGQDMLGHGKSVADADSRGYFGEHPHPAHLLQKDIHQLKQLVQKQYPGLPYFMFGHSMGSYLLWNYLCLDGHSLSGAVLCGTGFVSPSASVPGLMLIDLLRKTAGEHARSRLIDRLTFSSDYRKFDTTGKDPENSWLTRDPEIVKAYHADPLCGFRFTTNAYHALVESVLLACRMDRIRKISKTLPVLLISGDCDPVGAFGKGVKRTARAFQKAGMEQVSCILYPGARHELLNEQNKEEVYADVLRFFLSCIPEQFRTPDCEKDTYWVN